MNFVKQCCVGAALLTGVSLTVMSMEAQVPPPTLSNELLNGTNILITPTCQPNGTSTVQFTGSGDATGPYSGTFTESGTATIGPQTLDSGGGSSSGPLISFDAVFTISSGSTQITGTKALTEPITNPATQVA